MENENCEVRFDLMLIIVIFGEDALGKSDRVFSLPVVFGRLLVCL